VEVETVKDAVPLPVAVTVMVELPVPPGNIWAGDTAPAVTEVIVNTVPRLNETTTLCEITGVALVAVTVTVNDADDTPAASVHCRVTVCGVAPNVTLAGRVHVAVVDGTDTTCARLTVPVNPFCAVRVIVADPDAVVELTELGAVIVKSTTWKRIGPVEWLSVPSVPVTLTV
jgi:hypothetical protein